MKQLPPRLLDGISREINTTVEGDCFENLLAELRRQGLKDCGPYYYHDASGLRGHRFLKGAAEFRISQGNFGGEFTMLQIFSREHGLWLPESRLKPLWRAITTRPDYPKKPLWKLYPPMAPLDATPTE